jgi:hypothetical protein
MVRKPSMLPTQNVSRIGISYELVVNVRVLIDEALFAHKSTLAVSLHSVEVLTP